MVFFMPKYKKVYISDTYVFVKNTNFKYFQLRV